MTPYLEVDIIKNEFKRYAYSILTYIDKKDGFAHEHSKKVQAVMDEMVKELGLELLPLPSIAGYLHDIGKFAILGSLVKNRQDMKQIDFQRIKNHPRFGASMIETEAMNLHKKYPRSLLEIHGLTKLKRVVQQHHENVDGSGYPLGISDLPLETKIIGVADRAHGVAEERPYKPPYTIKETIAYLQRKIGTELDLTCVETFLKLLETEGTLTYLIFRDMETKYRDVYKTRPTQTLNISLSQIIVNETR